MCKAIRFRNSAGDNTAPPKIALADELLQLSLPYRDWMVKRSRVGRAGPRACAARINGEIGLAAYDETRPDNVSTAIGETALRE